MTLAPSEGLSPGSHTGCSCPLRVLSFGHRMQLSVWNTHLKMFQNLCSNTHDFTHFASYWDRWSVWQDKLYAVLQILETIVKCSKIIFKYRVPLYLFTMTSSRTPNHTTIKISLSTKLNCITNSCSHAEHLTFLLYKTKKKIYWDVAPGGEPLTSVLSLKHIVHQDGLCQVTYWTKASYKCLLLALTS